MTLCGKSLHAETYKSFKPYIKLKIVAKKKKLIVVVVFSFYFSALGPFVTSLIVSLAGLGPAGTPEQRTQMLDQTFIMSNDKKAHSCGITQCSMLRNVIQKCLNRK